MENSEFVIDKEKQTEFYLTIGAKLKEQRKALKFTQEDVGFILNISRVSVNNIENGKQRLPLHLIKAIADFLYLPLDVLVPRYTHKIKSISELRAEKKKTAFKKLAKYGDEGCVGLFGG